jgi:glycosyltransferase involved in cell wall biosynthesis
VGRISPIKDVMTLLEAVSLLRQTESKLRCALVGSPPERDTAYAEDVRRKVQALKLEQSVDFVGPVPHDQVVSWYQRSFAHVNCSPPNHSLDKTVLEAMACGKPSLSSTLGFRETMGKSADRLIFQHGNPADLAGKIESLLRLSDSERHAMGIELRESVVKQHNLEVLADRLVTIFWSLRDGRKTVAQNEFEKI